MHKLFIIALLCYAITTHAQPNKVAANETPENRDTFNIYFPLGSYVLTTAAKRTIDSLIYHDVLAPGRQTGIIGHTDNLGDEKANTGLSEKRAKAVAAYLQYMNIDSQYIQTVMGAGEILRVERGGSYPQDRKVAIIPGGFLKKETISIDFAFIPFSPGTASIDAKAKPAIDDLVKGLQQHPRIKVELVGHVCCYNFPCKEKIDIPLPASDKAYRPALADSLSIQRARIIYNILLSKGIEAKRLSYKSAGYTTPAMINGKKQHIDRTSVAIIKQ